mmetsp:Transcript_13633/g.25728  ORF Transcript_13633/g.25728 Transcript_13633/m.25728 type:complete len:169 (-) Transcript_13633:33-539(-)
MKQRVQKPAFTLDSCSISSKLPEYSGLTDSYLSGFFAAKRKRKLLLKQGLVNRKQINKQGEIIESHQRRKYFNTTRITAMSPTRMDMSSIRSSNTPESANSSGVRSKSVGIKKSRAKQQLTPISHDQLESLFIKYKLPALTVLSKEDEEKPGKSDFKTLITEVEEEEA